MSKRHTIVATALAIAWTVCASLVGAAPAHGGPLPSATHSTTPFDDTPPASAPDDAPLPTEEPDRTVDEPAPTHGTATTTSRRRLRPRLPLSPRLRPPRRRRRPRSQPSRPQARR